MVGTAAVCFDLDGTLCVRDRDDERIHEQLFERVGIDPAWEVEAVYDVDRDALPPVETVRGYWTAFYRQVAADAGADPGIAPALADATLEMVVDDPHVVFRDGAAAALEYARERLPVGLVTHGSERAQAAKLDALGIADAFDAAVFCGPTEPCPGKPDPEPFLRAAEDLGVAPERTLHVGNRLDGDVAGANAAGMRSAWVPEDDPTPDPEPVPDHVLTSMRELPDLLREHGVG